MLYENRHSGFVKLQNGYYVWDRFSSGDAKIIGLVPVKWDYIISNDYLKNGFANDPLLSLNYDISGNIEKGEAVKSMDGETLFYLVQLAG